MATETLILGLDVSMNSTGWAVLSLNGQTVRLVDSGIIKANTKHNHGHRLRKQRKAFDEIINKYDINYVGRESGFSRHIKSTQVLFKAYGVTEEFFTQTDEYAASTIKKSVTGNGKATKLEVEEKIRHSLKLKNSFEFDSDDESDAIGVALTLINERELS